MSTENQSKVLVIDDNKVLLMQVETVLEQNDYISICVDNGATGLEKAASEQPDLILLDRRMPEMDGNQTLMKLKDSDVTKSIPVIMLTGDNKITDVQTCFDLGAIDYIVKPFDQDVFLSRLEKALK